jgi:nitrite reductase/ring-hydroxylating ferredoxin subunit/uncharacterized membrane protein
MQPFAKVSVLENATALDRVSKPIRKRVRSLLGDGAVRNALHGVWLGHPVHPTLVQVAVGVFSSASVLDLARGHERSARLLIATGLASSGPAIVTGWADWSELHTQQQRVGLVHAGSNLSGLTLYSLSLAARLRGDEARGRALGWAGLTMLGFGGFLGSHLSFRQASGANHVEEVPHLVPAGWHDLCAVDDLGPEGTPERRMLGDVPLLVVRRGARVDVLSDRCSHLSGPLHEGKLVDGGTCVRCPWHGSEFRLDDGSVRRGPATAPAHTFDVKVEDGRLQVRLPGAGG